MLNELECQLTFSSTYHCYCYEYQESNRAAIQFALRLLGAKPKQGGCVLFKKCGREMITESALFIRMDRHQCLSKIIAGIPTEKAYQLLGAPDYFDSIDVYKEAEPVTEEEATENEAEDDQGTDGSLASDEYMYIPAVTYRILDETIFYMRYDVDAEPEAYTLFLWLSKDGTSIRSIEKFTPAFWKLTGQSEAGKYIGESGELTRTFFWGGAAEWLDAFPEYVQ